MKYRIDIYFNTSPTNIPGSVNLLHDIHVHIARLQYSSKTTHLYFILFKDFLLGYLTIISTS